MSILSTTRQPPVAKPRRALLAVLMVLIAASALPLAFAGPAAAGGGTGVPITLNSQRWLPKTAFGTIPPTAYLDDYGLVHLWGAAKGVVCLGGCSNQDFLGTLPPGPYTPQHNVFTIAHTNFGTYADVEIRTSGQIWLIDPRPPAVRDYSFVSLEGISYDPLNPSDSLQSPSLIHLNPPWSPDAKFNTAIPAAYDDADGGVHLEGAVTWPANQPQPTSPTELGSLPPGLEPPYNTYEIAHTNFGTYADVEITGKITSETTGGAPPPGQIILIPPRPPAAQDYAFVSLEGISWKLNQGPEFAFAGTDCLGPVSSDWTSPPDCQSGLPQTFGASASTVTEDGAGIVHLAGGFIATNPCCVPVVDVGTTVVFPDVPLSFAPSWNVFAIAHTNFGTYADIEIATDGSIRVIRPRPPAVTDFNYLSLDGITFAAASPKFFGLTTRETENQGATVTVTLRKPRVLALQVQTIRRHRLVTVGVVHVGPHQAGRSQIHWNLRVNRRPLRPGRYQVSLHALNGTILSVPAPPGARTLVVLANGDVHIQK